MKLKYILLVAAAALTLSLASIEIVAPEDPGAKPGIGSGTNGSIAGSKPGILSSSNYTIDGSNTIRYGQETN
jgi:hypothetical protein